MSSQLVWQLVKNYNCFLVKGLHGAQFSAEPGNLFNKHSYKYSGLANEKTLDIRADTDSNIAVTKKRSKNINKPSSSTTSSVIKKKNFRRTAQKLGKDAGYYRPDLKAASLARASAINKSSRVQAASKSS